MDRTEALLQNVQPLLHRRVTLLCQAGPHSLPVAFSDGLADLRLTLLHIQLLQEPMTVVLPK